MLALRSGLTSSMYFVFWGKHFLRYVHLSSLTIYSFFFRNISYGSITSLNSWRIIGLPSTVGLLSQPAFDHWMLALMNYWMKKMKQPGSLWQTANSFSSKIDLVVLNITKYIFHLLIFCGPDSAISLMWMWNISQECENVKHFHKNVTSAIQWQKLSQSILH